MAETQTFSYQPETTTETNLDQLTPDEQDSLAVGESIADKEEQVYAGKYKSAEDLEKALLKLNGESLSISRLLKLFLSFFLLLALIKIFLKTLRR